MERRFHCTACGQCCRGWIPLTLADALSHAARFPLALNWTVVPPAARAFALSERLGASVKLPKRGKMAVLVSLTAYIPPTFPCPELAPDGRCRIHAHKPLRCRTMPFYPYREERDQADLLVPRQGWACDVSAAAPVVYRDQRIVDRADFERERQALLEQAPVMRGYIDYALNYLPGLADRLGAMAHQPDSHWVTSLSSFLTAAKQLDAAEIAAQQLPVLRRFEADTAGVAELAEYQRHYAAWATEMAYLAAHAAG